MAGWWPRSRGCDSPRYSVPQVSLLRPGRPRHSIRSLDELGNLEPWNLGTDGTFPSVPQSTVTALTSTPSETTQTTSMPPSTRHGEIVPKTSIPPSEHWLTALAWRAGGPVILSKRLPRIGRNSKLCPVHRAFAMRGRGVWKAGETRGQTGRPNPSPAQKSQPPVFPSSRSSHVTALTSTASETAHITSMPPSTRQGEIVPKIPIPPSEHRHTALAGGPNNVGTPHPLPPGFVDTGQRTHQRRQAPGAPPTPLPLAPIWFYKDEYFVCSKVCPSSKTTAATQHPKDTYTDGVQYTLTTNNIVYGCSSITVNGSASF